MERFFLSFPRRIPQCTVDGPNVCAFKFSDNFYWESDAIVAYKLGNSTGKPPSRGVKTSQNRSNPVEGPKVYSFAN